MRTPMIHRSIVVCVLILFGATSAGVAEKAATRVRVKFTPDQTIQGTVVASDDATISVDTGGAGVVQIDRDSIQRIDRYQGQKRNWGYGLLAGVAAGWIVGGIVASQEPDEGEIDIHMDGVVAAGYGLIGGMVGAGVGTLIKSDRWESVPVSDVTIGVAPNREHGVAVTMSLNF